MKRPFRTGLVAGLLALALTGAACGSGPSGSEAKGSNKSEQAGAVTPSSAPAIPDTTAPPVETPASPVSPPPAPAPPAPTPAAPKPSTPATVKPTTTTIAAPKPVEKVTLRLGYFPNLTHASAIAGIEKGIYAANLGPNVDLKTSIFNA